MNYDQYAIKLPSEYIIEITDAQVINEKTQIQLKRPTN